MTAKRAELITSLTRDLKPVRPVTPNLGRTLGWLLLSTLLVTVLVVLVQPFRPNFSEQLLTTPRFALETLLGALAIVLVGASALRTSLPAGNTRLLNIATATVLLVWLSSFVLGLYFPVMDYSRLGKRPHCLWETLVYALPTAVMGIYLLKKGFVLNWTKAGFTLGLVAGLIPAWMMQLSCMYEPAHILQAHIAPALLVACLGALAGWSIHMRMSGG